MSTTPTQKPVADEANSAAPTTPAAPVEASVVAKKPAAVKKAVVAKKPATVKKPVAAKKPAAVKKPVAAKAVAEKKPAAKVAKAKSAPVAKQVAPVKEKVKKAKLVRDSFSMPETEYAVLGAVKKACLKAGIEVKKSELLRIGVALIQKMDVPALKGVLATLPPLKAGRPKQDK